MRIVTVANQKGGAGKTTTVANLAGALAEAGQRVLAVDLDSQAQLATALGAQDLLVFAEDGMMLSRSIAELVDGRPGVTFSDVVLHTPFENLDLLPSSDALDDARRLLESNPAVGLKALRRILDAEAMASQGYQYDWVIIDTPPKLDILLDIALIASDYVLAVLAPEMQQAEPLTRFIGRVTAVRENMHPDLKIVGVLFNKANHGWVATQQIPELLRSMDYPVMDTVIGMYSKLASSFGNGPVVLTAPGSMEAGVIREAAMEVVVRTQQLEEVLA